MHQASTIRMSATVSIDHDIIDNHCHRCRNHVRPSRPHRREHQKPSSPVQHHPSSHQHLAPLRRHDCQHFFSSTDLGGKEELLPEDDCEEAMAISYMQDRIASVGTFQQRTNFATTAGGSADLKEVFSCNSTECQESPSHQTQ